MPDLHEQGPTPSHERWLISFADFMTLLFAVFVVLYASEQSGKTTAHDVSEAVIRALQIGSFGNVWRDKPHRKEPSAHGVSQPTSAIDGQEKSSAIVIGELMPSLKYLTTDLQKEIDDGKLELRLEAKGLVISLRQAAFFESGQAAVNPAAYSILDKLAGVIATLPNQVRLEGHTDSIPIHNTSFTSNWELSAARSIAVLALLVERNKIPVSRISIAGFAETVPLTSNDDLEGRARNRRVDVVILNQFIRGPERGAK